MYFVCMHVCVQHVCLELEEVRKGASDSLGLEFQVVLSCHVDAGN